MDIDVPAPAAEGWKRGLLQILFVSMGQGDCCVITCPDGRHVMIDCGSKVDEKDSSWDHVAGPELLRSPYVFEAAGAERDLEALILTHPDIDHISKVSELLGAETASYTYAPADDDPGSKPKGKLTGSKRPKNEGFRMVKAKKVYFSHTQRTTDDFFNSPLLIYPTNDCSGTIYNLLHVEQLCCVSINATETKLDTWTKSTTEPITATRKPFSRADHATKNIDRNGVVVCSGKYKEKDWSIKIIAGNVAKSLIDRDPSDGDGRNAGSLVTLITYGADKILICGDMTVSTESYLLSGICLVKNDLQNLSLIQLPHHGSSLTSFGQGFADWVKAKRAVVSVQLYEHAHHLPGGAVIDRALAHAQDYDSHFIHYWRSISDDRFVELKNEWEDVTKGVKYTPLPLPQPNARRYLRTNAPADAETVIILDGLNTPSSSKKYALYQKPIAKEVRSTAQEGHIWYYFDGSGT